MDDLRYCKCGGKTFVSDSRCGRSGAIRRRRECKRCGERWTTYEVTADVLEMIEPARAQRARVERFCEAMLEAMNI